MQANLTAQQEAARALTAANGDDAALLARARADELRRQGAAVDGDPADLGGAGRPRKASDAALNLP